jgi:hypothetical protein
MVKKWLWIGVSGYLLLSLGCSLATKSNQPTAVSETPLNIVPLATHTPAPTPLPIQDATAILADACFDGLMTLDGQRLLIREEGELNNLYRQLESVCGESIPRSSIDFSNQVLVIAVDSVGACDAVYQPLGLETDRLVLQFTQTGDCLYDAIAIYAGTMARPTEGFQVVVIGA